MNNDTGPQGAGNISGGTGRGFSAEDSNASPDPQFPRSFSDEDELDEFMTRPSPALVEAMKEIRGDILILGVSGKMGPTLARMARRAAPGRNILGVARFSDPGVEKKLRDWDIETRTIDLLDGEQVKSLPAMENVIYMAGMKFGSSSNQPLTWAMNVHAAALAAQAFSASNIIAFSTGNIYPLSRIATHPDGATEDTIPGPVGEYAQSCLGRERMFEYFSEKLGTPGRIFRLNYAIDLRYGVLFDLARNIMEKREIDITMGHVNIIWQGDANEQALRLLCHCTNPASPINITGPEAHPVRWLAAELGQRMQIRPRIAGIEAPDALLSDSSRSVEMFGPPSVPVSSMLDWVADWVMRGKKGLDKPTRYEVRDGRF